MVVIRLRQQVAKSHLVALIQNDNFSVILDYVIARPLGRGNPVVGD